MTLLAIAFGVAIGVAVGMLGGGGSVLAVPVLVYVLGEDVEAATTVSLIVVSAAAVAAGLGHARARRVCWRHAGLFTAAAVPGIAAGTWAGNAADGRLLIAAFALVMVAAAVVTWRRASGELPEAADAGGHRCPAVRLRRDIVAGVGVGFLTGFFGVGGGFVVVPALAVALGFSIRSAIGTSLAIITITSAVGVAAHLGSGRAVDPELALAMGAASVAGALIGVRVSGRLPQRALGRGFAAAVVVIAAYLLASAAFLGGPPAGS